MSSRFEKILSSSPPAADFAKASAATRGRMAKKINSRESEILKIATGVGGPLIFSFVLWVLQDAQKKEIKRLYFMARDGYVMYRVAKHLVSALEFDIDLRYLYASRNLFRLAASSEIDRTYILKNIPWHSGMSAIAFFTHFDVERDVLDETSPLAQLPTENIDIEGYNNWINYLLSPAVSEVLNHKKAEQKKTSIAYLVQEGLADPQFWAFVDVGWNGSSQNFIGKLLGEYNGTKPYGYYLCARYNAMEPAHGIKAGYLLDTKLNIGRSIEFNRLESLIESFLGATSGPVTRIAKLGDTYEPQFLYEKNQPLINWGLPLVHRAIETFAEEAIKLNCHSVDAIELRDACHSVFFAFAKSPTPAEAKAWGSYPFEMHGKTKRRFTLISKYSFLDALRRFFKRPKSTERWVWPQGSLQCSGLLTSMVYKTAVRLKD